MITNLRMDLRFKLYTRTDLLKCRYCSYETIQRSNLRLHEATHERAEQKGGGGAGRGRGRGKGRPPGAGRLKQKRSAGDTETLQPGAEETDKTETAVPDHEEGEAELDTPLQALNDETMQ